MYDDYRTGYTFLGLALGLLAGIFFCILKRFDVIAGILTAGFVYLLSYNKGWETSTYIIITIAVIAVVVLLQHIWVGFRIIFGVLVCGLAAFIAAGFFSEVGGIKMYAVAVLAFLLTGAWAMHSWKYEIVAD